MNTFNNKLNMINRLDEECGNMAREGLRTLVIGRKKLSEEYFEKFIKEYVFFIIITITIIIY